MRALLGLAAMLALAPAPAAADEGDTVYGRLDADLVLSAGLGGGVAFRDRGGPDVTGTTTLELRARLLDTGGLLLAGEWRPEGDSRALVGVELRPLFLVRFFTNAQSGDRWLDLFVDSIGLELACAIGPFDGDLGLAAALGGGVELPLFLPDASAGGLFLRLAARWVGAYATDQLAPRGGVDDVVVLGVLTVRGLVSLGLARWEPPRYRAREPEDDP